MIRTATAIALFALLAGCSSAYYGTMETFEIH